jgi:hypothetical protein
MRKEQRVDMCRSCCLSKSGVGGEGAKEGWVWGGNRKEKTREPGKEGKSDGDT